MQATPYSLGLLTVLTSVVCFCAPSLPLRDRAATARKALASKGGRSTSTFRGVTHHVRTGRWEAHIWMDGKQVRSTHA